MKKFSFLILFGCGDTNMHNYAAGPTEPKAFTLSCEYEGVFPTIQITCENELYSCMNVGTNLKCEPKTKEDTKDI